MPYTSQHAGSLNFDANELIVVLERPISTQFIANWRGFILDRSTYTTRSGYFPCNHVRVAATNSTELFDLTVTAANTRQFITSSASSLHYQLKLNEIENCSIIESQQNQGGHDSINQTGSIKDTVKESLYVSQSQLEKFSKQQQHQQHASNTLASNSALMSFQTANVNSLSPSSSSSSSSSSSFSQTSSSLSQTSKQMMPFLNNNSKPKSVGELMRSGLTDSHIILNWLRELGMVSYYDLFVKSGYDLLTIMKATPADLSAIGILDPTHRSLLKQHMARLDIGEMEDKLNKFLMYVDSVEDMLKLIHLEQYTDRIRMQQNVYKNFDEFVTTLSCEDLEELGIEKLGHQKKLMLVVKKLKENLIQKNSKNLHPPPMPLLTSTMPNMQSLVQSLENLTAAESHSRSTSTSLSSSSNNEVAEIASSKPLRQQPPLPPRVSSMLMTSSSNCSYATMPRNKKPIWKSIETTDGYDTNSNNNSEEINHYSSGQTGNLNLLRLHHIESVSNPSSPLKMRHLDVNSLLVPPTPPPMPLISLPTPNVHKITRRISPFTNLSASSTQNVSLNLSVTSKLNGSINQMNLIDRSIYGKLSNGSSGSTNELSSTMMMMNNSLNQYAASNINENNGEENGTVALNDLDSMLCDLNKQLDAMLDVEKFRNSNLNVGRS